MTTDDGGGPATPRFSVTIDADVCETNAVCVQVAPEIFDIGPDDVARVSERLTEGSAFELATEAARRCPTGAIAVTPVTDC